MYELHRRSQRTSPADDSANQKDVKKVTDNKTLQAHEAACLLLVLNAAVILVCSKWPLGELSELPDVSSLKLWEFNYLNARQHLQNITNFGPRLTGSEENELFAPRYILAELENIKRHHLNTEKYTMEIDLQRVHGGSFRRFAVHNLHEYISVYQDIQNVVLRILPKQRSANVTLLVNSHYDTVPGSPGAGDDASSCALMIELARAIVSSEDDLSNGIVMLWNGAEEKMLQASHAFVTQHSWFAGPPRIAAFINLEAAGSSGREIAFQIGPENPWLIEAYAKTVCYAWASITAQEIFESGLIPSSTDFQQFRDYGHLPGIDLAFIQNGYVYHTQFDNAGRIADASLHRAGTNMLALIREVANSSLLADPGSQRYGKVVFYDILGMFMVVYPKSVATVLNLLVCALVTIVAIRPKLARLVTNNRGSFMYASLLAKMVVVIVFKLVSSLLCVASVALVGSRVFRHTMGWYSHSWPSLVYVLPAILAQLAVTEFSRRRIFSQIDSDTLEELHFDAFQLLFSVILFILTLMQIGSAYLLLIWILNAFVVRSLVYEKLLGRSATRCSPFCSIMLTFASSFFASVKYAYQAQSILHVFVPILGRTGTQVNAELTYAMLLAALFSLPLLSLGAVLYRIRLHRTFELLLAAFGAIFVALCLTNLAFPFSGPQSGSPAVYPRRITVSQVTRIVRLDNDVQENGTYLWLHSWDSINIDNLRDSLRKSVDLSQLQLVECDKEQLPYCGLPVLFPSGRSVRKHYLVRLSDSLYPQRLAPELKLVEIAELHGTKDTRRVFRAFFQLINAPAHTNLFVVNRMDVEFLSWTVRVSGSPSVVYDNLKPAYGLPAVEDGRTYIRHHYLLFYTRASPRSGEALGVDLDFAVSAKSSGNVSLAEVAFGSLFLHPPDRDTSTLTTTLENLPDWVNPYFWNGHYEARTVSLKL